MIYTIVGAILVFGVGYGLGFLAGRWTALEEGLKKQSENENREPEPPAISHHTDARD